MSKNSIKINVIARSVVTIVELLFSLFSFPYVARILAPESIGHIDFVNAAVAYFITIGSFGVAEYAGREIAQHRDDLNVVSSVLSKFLGLRLKLASVLIIIYLVLVVPFYGHNTPLFYWSTILILTSAFNLVWALEALEDFSYLATARVLSKVGLLVYLLTMVRTKEDVVTYFLGMILFDFIYYILAVFRLKATYHVKFGLRVLRDKIDTSELKNLFRIFIMVLIQGSIAGVPSLVMGHLHLFHDLGLLSTAMRFFWMGYYCITPLSTVLLSRSMSFKSHIHKNERFDHLDGAALSLLTLGVPVTFGLIATAADVIPLLVGGDYTGSILLLIMLSPLILLFVLNNFWSMQVVFSHRGDRALIISNSCGLATVILSSVILIPWLSATGAAISYFLTYAVMCAIPYFYGREYYRMSGVVLDIGKTLIAGIVMCAAIYFIQATSFAKLGGKIAMGVGIYLLVLFVFRHRMVVSFLDNFKSAKAQ
ncbi:polysaccharide biosynthesis C-terminal domain-containing protein [Bdellovibrio sp. KM01]|uniref:oligosaccharide flippase family protein n=1 Tax=Bdellovibrio sp. KM01 TaxID=2748865 RepID=UPI0015EA706D|nr:polysaccharide biosynthesis C-terminal domain-containing protein [Bdellovibrio sp. KM01]QLY27040.1 polysaccharide biosynthesis C-terminal domain-containing protein [Bdellovibrio sp. KM01]